MSKKDFHKGGYRDTGSILIVSKRVIKEDVSYGNMLKSLVSDTAIPEA